MSYGFDDNKGKVPIEPILNQLETNYQNNVNTIYNAITAQGTTPAGKSPQQIATAIGSMATSKFNGGYNTGYVKGKQAAEQVTFEQTVYFRGGPYTLGSEQELTFVEYPYKNVISATIHSDLSALFIHFISESGQTEYTDLVYVGETRKIADWIDAYKIRIRPTLTFEHMYGWIKLKYQMKILR